MEKYAIFIDGQGKTDMLEERVLFERNPLNFSVRAFVYLQKEADARLAAKDAEIGALKQEVTDWRSAKYIAEQKETAVHLALNDMRAERDALRHALDLLGVPAQAERNPDVAPPLRITVDMARRAMEVADDHH